jgi:unsaturated rhamnogalacturonyl hydrolase
MLAYTFAKASRLGYLPAVYGTYAAQAYKGILQNFIEDAPNGAANLKGTVAVSGLGGNPYRDGSFEYYMSEPVVVNDPKGMGAFILCATEMEMQPQLHLGTRKTVLLDNFFNNEWKKDATGTMIRWHYTWDERTHGGFHVLGHLFASHGAQLKSLTVAPTAANLAKASVYIIVDPDTDKETANPNYMQPAHVQAITQWVRNGGVLVLLANDAANCELEHFNLLSTAFGIRFNMDQLNMVKNDRFEEGAVLVPEGHTIFPHASRLFIKELSSITVSPPAIPVLQQGGKTIMAVSRLGKGWVFALGDPWLYNEYVDGRKLPDEFDNYAAAQDLVLWLLERAPMRGGNRK